MSDVPARWGEQGSAHPLGLVEPVRVSEKCGSTVLVNTDPIDISGRAQVTLDKEEIGLERTESTELVTPIRASLQETWVSLEEVVDVVQKVKRDLALLQIVEQFLVCPASERGHGLQLNLRAIVEARLELL